MSPMVSQWSDTADPMRVNRSKHTIKGRTLSDCKFTQLSEICMDTPRPTVHLYFRGPCLEHTYDRQQDSSQKKFAEISNGVIGTWDTHQAEQVRLLTLTNLVFNGYGAKCSWLKLWNG